MRPWRLCVHASSVEWKTPTGTSKKAKQEGIVRAVAKLGKTFCAYFPMPQTRSNAAHRAQKEGQHKPRTICEPIRQDPASKRVFLIGFADTPF